MVIKAYIKWRNEKGMYKIVRVLNHNTVIAALDDGKSVPEDQNVYLLMGKGIGFGKKPGTEAEIKDDSRVYSLQECSERGDAKDIVDEVTPEYLEVADIVLKEAEKVFGDIDRNILFSLADHIFYAVKRMKNNERISNPLTDDIRLLFHMEYKVASCAIPVIREKFGVTIDDDEVGYITLHVHSAIDDEKVSDAMQTARAVRQCVDIVENAMGKKIDVMSLAYNRLMNHVRYMIVRAINDEKLKMSLNDYMSVKYPDEFAMAEKICDEISRMIKHKLNKAETGYLAMHICRVTSGELEAEE